jgi:hypothetical protein
MTLSDKYDQFYKTDGQAHSNSDYPIRKWPRKRVFRSLKPSLTRGEVQWAAKKPV